MIRSAPSFVASIESRRSCDGAGSQNPTWKKFGARSASPGMGLRSMTDSTRARLRTMTAIDRPNASLIPSWIRRAAAAGSGSDVVTTAFPLLSKVRTPV